MKKTLASILCVSICTLASMFALVRFAPESPARAGSVTDTISVHIGYFGWGEDQFIEKATYSWRELDDLFGGMLCTHEVVYSYYSGSRTYLVAARGFYVRDLLECAGVDFGSISRIDFFTKDQTVGAYRSFTKSSLFDMPRYFFPNMAADEITGEVFPYFGGDIYDGARRVEPMLALEDYTEWDAVGQQFEELYDNTMFSASSRFHLFFGQLSPTEANTSSAAKYVYKLFITFSGTPVLSTDETDIEMKVGSDFKMTVNVSAEDSLLDEYVRDNLLWSSNNEETVSVDNYGNLTIKAEGEAVITAAFGESSVSVNVSVSADANEAGSVVAGSGGGHGGGQGSGSGSGDGSGQGSGTSERMSAPIAPEYVGPIAPTRTATHENTAKTADEVQYSENNKGVYILSSEYISGSEFAERVNSILNHGYVENGGGGGLNNARTEGMDEDAVQFILFMENKTGFIGITATAAAVFFAAGFGYGISGFRRKLKA